MLKNNKGMTLVELLCAMVLLMLIISGFTWFFSYSVVTAARTRDAHRNYNEAKSVSDHALGNAEAVIALSGDPSINARDVTLGDHDITVTIDFANDGTDVNPPPHPRPRRVVYVTIDDSTVYTAVDADGDTVTIQNNDSVFWVPVVAP